LFGEPGFTHVIVFFALPETFPPSVTEVPPAPPPDAEPDPLIMTLAGGGLVFGFGLTDAFEEGAADGLTTFTGFG
jgi:hypothetical protein